MIAKSLKNSKSILTNIFAVLIIIIGFTFHLEHLKPIGFYALSGAVTNWLAIFMLFEKIPFLYGSGVVPSRFQEFKQGIRLLIMNQFFNKQNIERFLEKKQNNVEVDYQSLLEKIDFTKIFDGLCQAIMGSQFGSMLSMFGGIDALKPLEADVTEKLQKVFLELLSDSELQTELMNHIIGGQGNSFEEKAHKMVEARLEELTPKMVKNIVQDMMSEHLGWLVVWGGVFGGLMGLGFSFL